jgi:hypothetical protein
MYTDIAGRNMVEAIVVVVENLSVEPEADVAECQMVSIVRSLEDVEEFVTEPQSDERLVMTITPK